MNRIFLIAALWFLLVFASSCTSFAFQLLHDNISIRRQPIITSTQLSLSLRLDQEAPREYYNFVEWANYYGVVQENGFQITEDQQNAGDWSVLTNQWAQMNSRVLFVPAMLILASQRARQEDFAYLQAEVNQFFIVDDDDPSRKQNLAPQFYLFLKILQEYELGEQSPYYAWLNALPRKFSTAVDMDDFEMDCLPPFVAALARTHRINFDLFMEILQKLPIQTNIISVATKSNLDVTKWAYNVVFTRGRTNAMGEYEIIPMADMFNHAAEANVELLYDNEGNCHGMLSKDVAPGTPLSLSYGQPTNPSRFLATYGFFDQSPPATFCKLYTDRTPSQELIHLGFDYSRMVFYVKDGAVAEEVWDVMLYSILEKLDPLAQRQFYEAHMRGDHQTKEHLHQIYILDTCKGLLDHVNRMLGELEGAADQMDKEGNVNVGQHNNLLMIRMHNDFVRDTFQKVKSGVEFIEANEEATRELVM